MTLGHGQGVFGLCKKANAVSVSVSVSVSMSGSVLGFGLYCSFYFCFYFCFWFSFSLCSPCASLSKSRRHSDCADFMQFSAVIALFSFSLNFAFFYFHFRRFWKLAWIVNCKFWRCCWGSFASTTDCDTLSVRVVLWLIVSWFS